MSVAVTSSCGNSPLPLPSATTGAGARGRCCRSILPGPDRSRAGRRLKFAQEARGKRAQVGRGKMEISPVALQICGPNRRQAIQPVRPRALLEIVLGDLKMAHGNTIQRTLADELTRFTFDQLTNPVRPVPSAPTSITITARSLALANPRCCASCRSSPNHQQAGYGDRHVHHSSAR